jgi:hypothetical protein
MPFPKEKHIKIKRKNEEAITVNSEQILTGSGFAGSDAAQGIGRKSTLWICLWKSRSTDAGGTRNCSGKPGFLRACLVCDFAAKNAPKKQKYKANTASSRVCQAPFSDLKARSKVRFGYVSA